MHGIGRDRSRNLWLAAASAFGVAGGLAATPALAADECGAPVAGRVTCTSAGNPYANGVTYSVAGDIAVTGNADATITDTVAVTAAGGAATVSTAGPVSTTAANHDGIDATATGDVAVTAASVKTSGANSAGIIAISSGGTATVTSASTTVGAAGGVGILAVAPGGVAISGGVTSAVDNAAISAISSRGPITIAVTGATTAGPVSDTAIRAASGTTTTVTVAAGATVSGTNGLTLSSETGSTVTNAGTITGTNGYAILINRSTSTVTNSGTITGRLALGGPNNNILNAKFINSGTFNISGFSLFGAGANSFTNSGTVQYLAAAPAGVSFFGLAAFANSGTLSLANGRAGDVLTLPGTFTGSGASTLRLDAATGTAGIAADRLVIGGAATGVTTVNIASVGGGAALLNAGTVVVQAGAGTSGGAFVLGAGSANSGFAHNNLVFNAGANSFSLITTPGNVAYVPLRFIEAARNITYRTTDMWSAHMRALRDAPGGGGRLWGEIYGGNDVRTDNLVTTVFGQTAAQDLSYRQDFYGGQGGFDIIQASGDSNLTAGVTGGFTSSHQNFTGVGTRAVYKVANGGGYVAFKAGPLFVNGLAKYDHYSIGIDNAAIGLGAHIHGHSYGATGEAGFRGEGGGFWFEPLVTVSYARTTLGDFGALASNFDFRQADGLRGKAGARAGTAIDMLGSTLTIYLGGNAVKEFRGRDRLIFTNNGTSLTFRDRRIPFYGEGFGGLNIGTGAVSGFFEGFGDYGKVRSLRGGGGRAGLRIAL